MKHQCINCKKKFIEPLIDRTIFRCPFCNYYYPDAEYEKVKTANAEEFVTLLSNVKL